MEWSSEGASSLLLLMPRLTSTLAVDRTVLPEPRSLKPWQHYVPFWNATTEDGKPLGMDDVYGAVAELRRMDVENPQALQQIVTNANNFAMR